MRTLLSRPIGISVCVGLMCTFELCGQINPWGSTPLAQNFTPLTGTERANRYWRDLVSPVSIFASGTVAGVNQWRNEPSEWGQGGDSFAVRFASAYGQHILNVSFSTGLAAILREDNRYFRSGETGTGRRLRYALTSSFMARHDDGSRHVSISRIAGYGTSAAVSRTWRPPGERSAKGAIGSFALSFAFHAGVNVVREFFVH